ncbi:hypothetical protein E4K39_03640 [Neisseria meningitidis]|uniref:Phage structural protein n=1 Tax=Neisseria meningitidis TaxID=487 RepID=A0AB33TXD9_NEIME|nr:hypothetical protein [Neisseria meningitidis]EJU64180.1 putative phage structural protein [Neisseria meningitidis 98008]MBG8584583.1 hypothetical protein [Neisseria meningitidis]MBG8586980.1 hypothetical protein [Neisseria meningitidis]MBG8591248.1 hypothetical protein [Neisseria meningitidis]MBG8600420.1 hypothetical protein [Neisseria meningitidis]
MAKIHVKNNGGNRFGGVPYGNMAVEHYRIVAKEDGTILGADAYGPPKADDVLVLGVLEQGFRLDDAQIIVKTAMSSGITADVGFVYADGADDANVPQDAAYFASDADFASAARIRCQSAKLVTLPKQALLTVTLKEADSEAAADIDILIYGEKFGQL